jgi:hypothetical protein
MSLKTVDGKGAPCIARQFATTTAAVLHEDARGGGDAPDGVRHLPAGVVLDGTDATATADLVFIDATGTTVTMALQPGVFHPIAPAELDATNVPVVTVFWHRGASGLR